jgi:transposase
MQLHRQLGISYNSAWGLKYKVDPVDMRRGIDGLSMIVQQALGHSPCSGSAFVFCNRAGNRIKVLL